MSRRHFAPWQEGLESAARIFASPTAKAAASRPKRRKDAPPRSSPRSWSSSKEVQSARRSKLRAASSPSMRRSSGVSTSCSSEPGDMDRPEQPDDADDDEVQRDDVVEQPRHDEDQDAGDERYERAEGEGHDMPP